MSAQEIELRRNKQRFKAVSKPAGEFEVYDVDILPLNPDGTVDLMVLESRINLLVRTIAYRKGVGDESDEVMQEVLLRIDRNYKKYQGKGLLAWVNTITTNICFSILRKRRRLKNNLGFQYHNSLDSRDILEIPEVVAMTNREDLQEEYLLKERDKQIRRVLALLSLEDRKLLELYYLHEGVELSYSQIADMLSVSYATVKRRIQRAKVKAKKLFIQQGFSSIGEVDASEPSLQ